jgi:hypothetical protein
VDTAVGVGVALVVVAGFAVVRWVLPRLGFDT